MDQTTSKEPRPMLGVNGFKYKEKFGVIVMCKGRGRPQGRV